MTNRGDPQGSTASSGSNQKRFGRRFFRMLAILMLPALISSVLITGVMLLRKPELQIVEKPVFVERQRTVNVERPTAVPMPAARPDAQEGAPPKPVSGTVVETSHLPAFWVVVSSTHSQDLAGQVASEVRAQASEYLQNKAVKVRRMDFPGKGTFYRVVIEPPTTRADAIATCVRLGEMGFKDCFPAASDSIVVPATPPAIVNPALPTASSVSCAGSNVCTPVSVFFGTDRKRQDMDERVAFGPDRAARLQLGLSIVTVPRAPRRRGEILRPSMWEQKVLRLPAGGDPAKHFTIPKDGITLYTSVADFLFAVRTGMLESGNFKDHVFVFVHGYRVPFDDALYRTAQIAYDLGDEDGPFGTAFLYSWPSGGNLTDYKYDFDSARLAVDHLKTFLDLVINQTGARYVHLIGHSMGSWTLLAALGQIAKHSMINPPVLNQIILAAPDIDAAEFAKMADSIANLAKGVTLYASSNDLAMKLSREVHRGVARAGDVHGEGPSLFNGIDTIDVSALTTDVFSAGHAEYAERKELLNDIKLLFRKGERPPHVRMPILERVRVKDQLYWRYPN